MGIGNPGSPEESEEGKDLESPRTARVGEQDQARESGTEDDSIPSRTDSAIEMREPEPATEDEGARQDEESQADQQAEPGPSSSGPIQRPENTEDDPTLTALTQLGSKLQSQKQRITELESRVAQLEASNKKLEASNKQAETRVKTATTRAQKLHTETRPRKPRRKRKKRKLGFSNWKSKSTNSQPSEIGAAQPATGLSSSSPNSGTEASK